MTSSPAPRIDQVYRPIHARPGLVGWIQFKGALGQSGPQGWAKVSDHEFKLANDLYELPRTPEKYSGVHISHGRVSKPSSEFFCPAIYSLQPFWALNFNNTGHCCHRRDVPIHVDHSNSRPPNLKLAMALTNLHLVSSTPLDVALPGHCSFG